MREGVFWISVISYGGLLLADALLQRLRKRGVLHPLMLAWPKVPFWHSQDALV